MNIPLRTTAVIPKNKKIRRDTIIAPILDVLEKAARHYDRCGEELEVDAVILNGGMSKLYLVKDRIREFFDLEPITTADPDLSVANEQQYMPQSRKFIICRIALP